MKLRNLLFLVLLFGCNQPTDTSFGKKYNPTRISYGSPIIHDYMNIKLKTPSYEFWTISEKEHNSLTNGFHAEKGFHILEDSILQEDDIFRKRINDTTFIYLAILTYRYKSKHEYTGIYLDTIDARKFIDDPTENVVPENNHKEYNRGNDSNSLTIEKADSILESWGTSRTK